jgi:hypothetical protein
MRDEHSILRLDDVDAVRTCSVGVQQLTATRISATIQQLNPNDQEKQICQVDIPIDFQKVKTPCEFAENHGAFVGKSSDEQGGGHCLHTRQLHRLAVIDRIGSYQKRYCKNKE